MAGTKKKILRKLLVYLGDHYYLWHTWLFTGSFYKDKSWFLGCVNKHLIKLMMKIFSSTLNIKRNWFEFLPLKELPVCHSRSYRYVILLKIIGKIGKKKEILKTVFCQTNNTNWVIIPQKSLTTRFNFSYIVYSLCCRYDYKNNS